MNDNKDRYFEDNEILDIVRKYEYFVNQKAHFFFDVHDFESVINYFLENMQVEEATYALELACLQHPMSTEIQLKKTRLLIDNQKYIQAREITNRLESLDPLNYEIHFLKGVISLYEKQPQDSARHFEKAMALAFGDRHSLIFDIASCYQLNGYFAEAVSYFETLHKEDPENTDYLFDMANCFDYTEDFDSSIACYLKAIDIEPYSEFAWHSLGMVYSHIGDWDMAIESYDFAIAINEKYVPAYYNKADVYVLCEEYYKAIAIYNELNTIDNESAQTLCLIGECYEKLCLHQIASGYFLKAIELNKSFAEAWYGIGVNQRYLGNFAQSIKYLQTAINLDGENMQYQFALGEVYQILGQKVQATHIFQRIVSTHPYMPEAWIELASSQSEANIGKAINILSDGLYFNHSHAVLNYTLSTFCYSAGRYAMAYKYFEKGLSLDFNQHAELLLKFPDLATDTRISELLAKYNC